MGEVGQREFCTQQRVVAFFREALGYACLGHWQNRANNRNVEPELVRDWLERQGFGDGAINDRFRELMDRLMPQWRLHGYEHNRAPLAHEEWRY